MLVASRRNRLIVALPALVVPALVLASVLAWGQASPPATRKNDTAARDYARLCTQGNAKYASHDYEGAVGIFKKASELVPHPALALYLLGEAQLAAGNLSDAEASWSRASTEVTDKDPALHARILFVTADIKEREKKWDDAKVAWQAYLDWVNRFQNNGSFFPASALSRQQVIDTMLKQDKLYEGVRQRIAATQDGGVFSDPSKPTPGGK